MKQLTANLFWLFIFATQTLFGQGNHVFTFGEATNYGSINLATPGGQSWSTDRAALPGYFSATNGASYSGASDAANVNGYVKKYGNEIFTFPVGTGSDLRSVTVNNSSGQSSDAYSIAWILGNPTNNLDPTTPNSGAHPITSVGVNILSVSPIGQWDWQVGDGGNLGAGTTGTGMGVPITVSIPDMTTFAVPDDLRLVGWNGSQWIDLSGGPSATGNTENSSLSGTMAPGISAVGVGSASAPLPVKLINFYAKENNCTAELTWITAEESNVNRYEVEQSVDGIRFETVALVKSLNSTSVRKYYASIMTSNIVTYYRLKMLDIDGKFEYSNTILLKSRCFNSENYASLFPNPSAASSSEIKLKLNTGYSGTAFISIVNSIGQQIFKQKVYLKGGGELFNLNSNMGPGLYYLELMDESGKKIIDSQKIIKY